MANDNANDIVSALKIGSTYTWNKLIEIKKRDISADVLDHTRIENLVHAGGLSELDFFIIKSVYFLGVANSYSIGNYVVYFAKGTPMEEIVTAGIQKLSHRLSKLASYGLLTYYEFKYTNFDDGGNSESHGRVYFCSYEGWKAAKTHYSLHPTYGYDSSYNYMTPTDIFKRVCTKAVLTAFEYTDLSYDLRVDHYHPSQSANIKYKEKTYAEVIVSRDAGNELILIEPVFFHINPLVISDKDNINAIKFRLNYLKTLIELHEKSEENKGSSGKGKILIVLEDYDGLKKLQKLISCMNDEDQEFFLEHIYLTSDVIINRATHMDVINATLKFVLSGTDIRCKVVPLI